MQEEVGRGAWRMGPAGPAQAPLGRRPQRSEGYRFGVGGLGPDPEGLGAFEGAASAAIDRVRLAFYKNPLAPLTFWEKEI